MTEEITYCAVHPTRETGLRCNKCDRYMCSECAVQTPVGYRCRECVRQVEDRFYDAQATDGLIVLGVTAGLSMIAGVLFGYIGGFGLFIAMIAGLPAGAAIAGQAMKAIARRKGRNTWKFGVAGVMIGVLVGAFIGGMLAYPDSLRIAYENFQQMSLQTQDNIRRGGLRVMSQTDFAFGRVLTLNVLLFAGLAAYSVYHRMKS
jgi:hypothetical protein